MRCSSCGKTEELHPRRSRLLSQMTLYLCNVCMESNYEPRYLIVIHGRAGGFGAIAEYIRNHRYVGAEIKASELV